MKKNKVIIPIWNFMNLSKKFGIMGKKIFNSRKFNFRFPKKLRLSVLLKYSPNL